MSARFLAHSLIGHSEAMENLRESIRKTAPTEMTVLIQGETGTGKELVAQAIHQQGSRAAKPFVAMNCTTLPENLVESLLFGHTKGAFTGADKDTRGTFEAANGGTLFLDEIGEISLAVQAKLLRVLQEHEIERVGGHGPVRVDFRLIAATNRDLEDMAANGTFREDLYHRLNVDCIWTPALRERPEDIPDLANHFVGIHAPKARREVLEISPEVLGIFRKYSWPGNVRELENVIQRAVHTGEGATMTLDDLPEQIFRKTALASIRVANYEKAIEDLSRQLCVCALGAARGNWRKAARMLELDRSTFYRIARRHGFEVGVEI
jgi:transcriptional regulator with GAF, ATPase, and Fis domain